jgi:thioredoxin reductase
MNSSPKAIIVGAGIAGIAAAIRLAVQGMDVHVFEKNAYPVYLHNPQILRNCLHWQENPSGIILRTQRCLFPANIFLPMEQK